MIDFRPVAYVCGVIVACFGSAMFVPMLVDMIHRNGEWKTFAVSGVLTFLVGTCMALSTRNAVGDGLTIRQTFILTTGVFVVIPMFGALPFMFGASELSFTDALFESMSGITTTGSTVIVGLDAMPRGLLLWRGMLQWLGGVSVIIVALVFLPLLRVGGMQLFRWDSYDSLGTILPRAAEVTRWISLIYLLLSAVCLLAFLASGLQIFDAIVYTMTTVATGGFATHDTSFQNLPMATEYVAPAFMFLASLPFFRYYQLANKNIVPLFRDAQIRSFIRLCVVVILALVIWQVLVNGEPIERAFRQSLFNGMSILTGTGYVSADYGSWGSFPVVLFFTLGLIGGCAGSTSCSVKIFRFQLLFAAIQARIQKIKSPHAVVVPRYAGMQVPGDVVRSVLVFFVIFIGTLAGGTMLLALSGLDFVTALSGTATALANVGPGLGPIIGPTGTFAELDNFPKWVLTFLMLAGRLELSAVYALLSVKFWQG
ncbi:MAG: TrkH family potassium uptake protein [Rhodobacteraceae bacterium]|nr:TrkH family potassium uptake protein [Paracoccaceae bacterium]